MSKNYFVHSTITMGKIFFNMVKTKDPVPRWFAQQISEYLKIISLPVKERERNEFILTFKEMAVQEKNSYDFEVLVENLKDISLELYIKLDLYVELLSCIPE